MGLGASELRKIVLVREVVGLQCRGPSEIELSGFCISFCRKNEYHFLNNSALGLS